MAIIAPRVNPARRSIRSASVTPITSLPVPTAPPGQSAIENVLPLSGCRLRVIDLPDGSRVGQLFGPDGSFLDEASCDVECKVSGWFGRPGPAGTAWALAFGAGGSHEALEVSFAGLRSRRVVPVVSDHYGLWVAEVAGSFRAATILSARSANTFRLHYTAAA